MRWYLHYVHVQRPKIPQYYWVNGMLISTLWLLKSLQAQYIHKICNLSYSQSITSIACSTIRHTLVTTKVNFLTQMEGILMS